MHQIADTEQQGAEEVDGVIERAYDCQEENEIKNIVADFVNRFLYYKHSYQHFILFNFNQEESHRHIIDQG